MGDLIDTDVVTAAVGTERQAALSDGTVNVSKLLACVQLPPTKCPDSVPDPSPNLVSDGDTDWGRGGCELIQNPNGKIRFLIGQLLCKQVALPVSLSGYSTGDCR